MAMGSIHILDEVTANKIAAGEVVERPAAVVKELVENALDAGASRIDIAISGGGMASIRVTDNGSGMTAEDVPLALLRHATSKISHADDLDTVLTMGFRGEALPSIAAVSRFRLTTRRACDVAGTEIIIHGGKTQSLGDTGCAAGTEIRVEELFYNTPARLKFMKSEGSETAKITDTIQRLALAWPEVSFSLSINHKSHFTTAGNGQTADAAAQVLGRQNMRQMIPFRGQGELVILSGFVAKPELARANRNLQYFYVNRRSVRSPLLSDALQTAYHTLLPRNRFPAAVVFLEIDPRQVDVNVHPAKREVRFSSERDIYRQIVAGIRKALAEANLMYTVSQTTGSPFRETAATFSFYDIQSPRTDQTTGAEAFVYKNLPAADQGDGHTEFPPFQNEAGDGGDPFGNTGYPRLRPIGQYRGTYILAQSDAGELFVVDQHAAHERVLYDQIKQDISLGNLPVQDVIPQTFELDPLSASRLENSLDLFANMGLTFENFGNNTFILRTIPLFFRHCLSQDELLELISQAAEAVNPATLFEKALQMMSCKGSVKANQPLDKSEMESLLNHLKTTDQPFTCPHGRPTTLVLSEDWLAKNFRRQ
jgi:DNA mismatch repair protein MutL